MVTVDENEVMYVRGADSHGIGMVWRGGGLNGYCRRMKSLD